MIFKVLWACDDEFCTWKHGPTEIDESSENEAIKYVAGQRQVREILEIEILPYKLLSEERVLWEKPVGRY